MAAAAAWPAPGALVVPVKPQLTIVEVVPIVVVGKLKKKKINKQLVNNKNNSN